MRKNKSATNKKKRLIDAVESARTFQASIAAYPVDEESEGIFGVMKGESHPHSDRASNIEIHDTGPAYCTN